VRRPALLRRFPFPGRPVSEPVVPAESRVGYPTLDADFRVLDDVVARPFEQCDLEALDNQRAYRVQQIVVILGSALVSVLGAVEAAFAGQRWWGIAVAVAGVLVAGGNRFTKERGSLRAFLKARIQAERLRGEYFRFLARMPPYDADDRVRRLRQAVGRVRRGREPR
jgi:hypothetical protein